MKSFRIGCTATAVLLIAVASGIGAWMLLDSGTTEMPGYHPFRSAKAKEQYLKLYDARAEKWPVTAENRTVNTSYGSTFVRISGPRSAPPLVLLHGFSGSSLQWASNVEALSESFRVYAVDTIDDYGRSVCTQAIEGPGDYVNWLDELFTALQLRNHINLVGLSYGGWLTTQYALRFPDRLDKMVLLAPAGTVLPLRLEWILRAILCALPPRYFTKSFMYWLLEDLVHKGEAGRRMVDQWVDDSFVAVRSFKRKHMVSPTVLKDSELQSVSVPILFLVGENEKIYSAQEAVQRLNRVAPHIRAEIIPNAGHDLSVVQADTVNKKILEFLRQR